MNGELRFIADASLSGLAKWLRLLGYDTATYFQEAGPSMMRRAQEEERILLTRRKDMAQRQFSGRMLLLDQTDKLKQLAFIASELSLNVHPEKMFTICLVCNEYLHSVKREEVQYVVPEYVYENCKSYKRCAKCGKIYWTGTHGAKAMCYLKNHGVL